MSQSDAYWLELLLQSKNSVMFSTKERSRFGQLLGSTDHFKEAMMNTESRKKVMLLYKYAFVKKHLQGELVCDAQQADESLFVVLYGSVTQFSNTNHHADFEESEKQEDKSSHSDKIESTSLLEFVPGSAFGVYTPSSHAKFIATSDSSILVIPAKSYEKLFPAEVARFGFVNKYLAKGLLNPICEGPPPSSTRGSAFFPTKMQSMRISSQQSLNQDVLEQRNDLESSSKKQMNVGEWFDPKQQCQMAVPTIAETYSQSSITSDKFISSFQIAETLDRLIPFQVVQSIRTSKIIFAFEMAAVPEKKYLFCDGDNVEFFYLLRTGTLSLRKNGSPSILRKYLPGDFLGFEDELGRRNYSCFVEEADTFVYRIKKQVFEANIGQLGLKEVFLDSQRAAKKQLDRLLRDGKFAAIQESILKRLCNSGKLSVKQEQVKNKITKELLTLVSLANNEELSPTELADVAANAAAEAAAAVEQIKHQGKEFNLSPMRRSISHPRVRFNDNSSINEDEGTFQRDAFASPFSLKLLRISPVKTLRVTTMEPQNDSQQRMGMNRLESTESIRRSLPDLMQAGKERIPVKATVTTKVSAGLIIPQTSVHRLRMSSSMHDIQQQQQQLQLNQQSMISSQSNNANISMSSSSNNNVTLSFKLPHGVSGSHSNRFSEFSRNSLIKRQIIQMSSLNEIMVKQKQPMSLVKQYEGIDLDNAGINGNNLGKQHYLQLQPHPIRPLTSKRIIMRLQKEVERSLLNIPKNFQDKLWGNQPKGDIKK